VPGTRKGVDRRQEGIRQVEDNRGDILLFGSYLMSATLTVT